MVGVGSTGLPAGFAMSRAVDCARSYGIRSRGSADSFVFFRCIPFENYFITMPSPHSFLYFLKFLGIFPSPFPGPFSMVFPIFIGAIFEFLFTLITLNTYGIQSIFTANLFIVGGNG